MYYWWGEHGQKGLHTKETMFPLKPFAMAGMQLHVLNDSGLIDDDDDDDDDANIWADRVNS